VNIGILGAGSWAIALAVLLRERGHSVAMWEFNQADADMLRTKREHPQKLPGIFLQPDIIVTNSIPEALKGADLVLCVVPSQTMRATMKSVAAQNPADQLGLVKGWIIASKGIECGSLNLMNEILLQELPGVGREKIVVLSGPSHAEEVSRGIPTSIVAASDNLELSILIQTEFSTNSFRIYTNSDITGVELASSTKNVIALAAGICDGLGFGDNTKGALLTRGMVEMIRLGKKMGAKEETFYGLAGFGDLVTTCISRHSRNRKMGELIASGLDLAHALGKMVMVAEGVETTKSVNALAAQYNIEMPITTEVYKALFEGKSAKLAVRDLMMRSSKPERYDQ
jgi:glycerol-3-phosphate dehydrogenase (NAD(P)+)